MKVAVIGTTGYGGIELLRILHSHPVFQIQSIHSTKGEVPIWKEYPHLFNINNQVLEVINPEEIAEKSDLVFLATPSGVSGQLAAQFAEFNIKLVDLSGDLRLKNTDEYTQWYKHEAAPKEIIDKAVYGLTEWSREQVAGAQWISNPGCYSTASLLGLGPIVKEKLIDPSSIIIDAKSGTSGAGRKPTRTTMHAEMSENFKIYKVNEHQHIPEIEQGIAMFADIETTITFNTHLIPMTRGILATSYAQVMPGVTNKQLNDCLLETYKNHPFVRVVQDVSSIGTNRVKGSNYCDIFAQLDERTNRATIVGVIDNLVKGAAGQAIQNMNVQTELPQTLGLDVIPLFI